MPPADRTAWVRLGGLLAARRAQISPRYGNRRLFASEREMNWRTLHDIELAKRDNFRPETMRAFEAAYMLAPGSLDRTLAGGDLEPLPPLRAVPDQPLPGDDSGIAALVRDWPELETLWRLRDADGKLYPREERLRLVRAHLDTIRRKLREMETRTNQA